VLHAWRRTSARLTTEDDVRKAVEKLCRALNVPSP
jgi:hypothetical protein